MIWEWTRGLGSILVALWLLIPVGNWVCVRILTKTGLLAARNALVAETATRDALARETLATQARAANIAPPPVPPPDPKAGGWIGGFERLLITAGLVAGAWEIMAAVIALKTVARFKEIDQQIHAEYFLVGSLFSIVWAFMVSRAWLLFDERWGPHLSGWLFKVAAAVS